MNNLYPLPDTARNTATKAEVLSHPFASAFNSKSSFPQHPAPELGVRDEEQNEAPPGQEETASDLLLRLDTRESVGPGGIHPGALREPAEELAKPFPSLPTVPADWGGAGRLGGDTVPPVYKRGRKEDPGNQSPVSPTSVPGR